MGRCHGSRQQSEGGKVIIAILALLLCACALGWARDNMLARHYLRAVDLAERRRAAQQAIAARESANCANAHIEVLEWQKTAGMLASENKTLRASVAKLKQEVTELHENCDTLRDALTGTLQPKKDGEIVRLITRPDCEMEITGPLTPISKPIHESIFGPIKPE